LNFSVTERPSNPTTQLISLNDLGKIFQEKMKNLRQRPKALFFLNAIDLIEENENITSNTHES
jgi:hypothetical protein